MRDEVIETPFYGYQSDVITLGINNLSFPEDEITRGGDVERLGKRDLCSEEGDFSLPMGIYQQKGIESMPTNTISKFWFLWSPAGCPENFSCRPPCRMSTSLPTPMPSIMRSA